MTIFFSWLNRLILRSLWRNKLRTALTMLGVMLGVAILLAINLANEMALRNFTDSIDRVGGKSNLTIRPTQSDILDERLLNNLRWLWLLPEDEQGSRAHFNPAIEQTALWLGTSPAQRQSPSENPPEVIQVLGLDLLGVYQNTDTSLNAETGKLLTSQSANPQDILKPTHAYVGESLAREHQLRPGSQFPLAINDRLVNFTVAGILAKGELGSAYGGNLMVMDIANVQETFGMAGQLSKVDLIIPDVWLPQVQEKLKTQLPPGLSVERPTQRSAQVSKMLRSYQYNLTTLSFIALLVGVFLIYNTMSITIIRRRPEIGTLRTMGFSKWHIFSLFLLEALIIGLVGTILGLGFGIILSTFAVKAVATTVANLYTGQVLDSFSINPWVVLTAFIFGLLMTLAGAIVPVLEATAVQPAEASRRASYESKTLRISGRLALAGIALASLALWCAFQPPVSGLPLFGFASALLIILAMALWMPWLLKVGIDALLPLIKQFFHTEGRLAALILRGALGRTAVAIASLMIGIAMMVSLAVMISSFRQTVVTWVQQTLKADLWIEPVSRMGSKQSGRIQPDIVALIRHLPSVAGVDSFYEFPLEYHDNPTRLGIGDFDVLANHGNLLFTQKELPVEMLRQSYIRPSVIVTEAFATRNHVGKGDFLALDTPVGKRDFTVLAVYYDYSSDLGYIVMPRYWYQKFYPDNRISNLAVYLRPGVSAEQARLDVERRLLGKSRLNIRSNRELREEVLRIFDRTFAITYALHVIAIAVALLAVLNSLLALVLEARREFGILKYLGAEDRQIGKMVLVQAGLLGLFGNVSGLLVGFLLSFLLINVINKQSFGWTIRLETPWGFLTQSFLLVMATALVSGLLPARLASKTPAPEVIKSE
jgi:putative ABC transport system permease protein